MTNYTKTTNFASKDTLPSGNANKIVKGTEIDTEFNNIATAVATKADTAGPTLTGTTTFETLSDGTISITAFVDEDNMASDSATLLPTQQSVKAYVDSQVTAQDLDFQADTGGALSIDLDSETLTFTGGTGIDTSGALNAVTFAIDSTVATLTGSQTLSNKTLATPVVSGNLTTDGLIDGRDVATDGTKLDGIEASADVTDTANVTAAGALMDSELTDIAAVKALNQGVATTDSPTFAGLTTTADVSFGDNDKAIFGAGSDLQIYHDGTHSVIEDAGTGNLILQSNGTQVSLQSTTELYLTAANNGAVTAYHNGSAKLATTSSGIDCTGTVTADGLTVDGASAGTFTAATFTNTTSANGTRVQAVLQNVSGACNVNLVSERVGANFGADFIVETSDTVDGTDRQRLRVAETGDISFYEDTGTTPKLFWDASAESLGINDTAPARRLSVNSAGTQIAAKFESTSTTSARIGLVDANTTADNYVNVAAVGNDMALYAGAAERVRIDANGLVGIGTSIVSRALHVNSGATNEAARFESTDTEVTLELKDTTGTAKIKSRADFRFETGSTPSEAMRITSSGNVGIGTSSPTTALTVSTDGTEQLTINRADSSINSGNTVGTILFTGDDPSANQTGARIQVLAGANWATNDYASHITFSNDSSGTLTERMRILSTGGITFNGDTAQANALDDYEEGTWTPAYTTGSHTYTTASTRGVYTKIGDCITFSGVVTTSSLTQSGDHVRISLPFTALHSEQANFVPVSLFVENGYNPSGGAGNMQGIVTSGDDDIQLYTVASGTGNNYTIVTFNDLKAGSGTRIRFSGHYYV